MSAGIFHLNIDSWNHICGSENMKIGKGPERKKKALTWTQDMTWSTLSLRRDTGTWIEMGRSCEGLRWTKSLTKGGCCLFAYKIVEQGHYQRKNSKLHLSWPNKTAATLRAKASSETDLKQMGLNLKTNKQKKVAWCFLFCPRVFRQGGDWLILSPSAPPMASRAAWRSCCHHKTLQVTKEQNLTAIYSSAIRPFSCLNWNRKKGTHLFPTQVLC